MIIKHDTNDMRKNVHGKKLGTLIQKYLKRVLRNKKFELISRNRILQLKIKPFIMK